jgi:hypothetical protein
MRTAAESRALRRAALGLRAHSGWAALVVLGGSARAPEVVDRRRLEIADPDVNEMKQPYHAAEGLSPARAERLLAGWADHARERAHRALAAALEGLRARGRQVAGGALLIASGRPLPSLEKVLASHALIHTADGEFYREALAHAAGRCGLPLRRIREREVADEASALLRLDPDALRKRIGELGRGLPPPWTQDQKLAAMGAWMALAGPKA